MSRYRPPRAPSTALITPEGDARMRAELHELWHVRRPQVTQSVSEAAAQGDRSENAEYTYGKKMLREIDSRVRFLRKRLESLKVVSQPPSDTHKVYFGAWVTVIQGVIFVLCVLAFRRGVVGEIGRLLKVRL